MGAISLASRWEPSDLPESVLNTISQARALPGVLPAAQPPFYVTYRWYCSFLQELLERGRSPSTLKVYVAAIAASHAPIEEDL